MSNTTRCWNIAAFADAAIQSTGVLQHGLGGIGAKP
jgi:hypothetical protein